MVTKLASGVAHTIPTDLRAALTTSTKISAAWNDLTPLGRNEYICWAISVKKAETRAAHIKRLTDDITRGKRRPCCFAGCPHRK